MRFPLSSALAAGALALAACSHEVKLKPAAEAERVSGTKDAALAYVKGVRVQASGEAWNGNSEIRKHVTPMQVTIENTTDAPVRIQYRDFHLVAGDGTTYAALPPFQTTGTVSERVLVNQPPVMRTGEVSRIGWQSSGFEIAPAYAPLYPNFPVYRGVYTYDPVYYSDYNGYYADTVRVKERLPTADMLVRAMPEGVLYPGGTITGFLYFQHVPRKSADALSLKADLVNAQSQTAVGTLTIPFKVEG